MPRFVHSVRLITCTLIFGMLSATTADDEIDPAFQRAAPESPLALAPENYLRSEWSSRYVEDVTGFLEAHPDDPYAARLCFDWFLVAKELEDEEQIRKSLEQLLLRYPGSIQAHLALSQFPKARHFLKFVSRCIDKQKLTTELRRQLVPLLEYGSQRWGAGLWRDDSKPLYAAILCAQEPKAVKTRATLEQAFFDPQRGEHRRLLRTLDNPDATSEQLLVAIFDSGVKIEDALNLFLPELERRNGAEGAEKFFDTITTAEKLQKDKQLEEFLKTVSELRNAYSSQRLAWAELLVLTNSGKSDEAKKAAESLIERGPPSRWTSLAKELTDSFENADRLRDEQAKLLVAVADRYHGTPAAQFQIRLFNEEAVSLEGDVIPAGAIIFEQDQNEGFALVVRRGDRLPLQMSLARDDKLRLFVPALDPTQVFVHKWSYPHSSLITRLECEPESKTTAFKFQAQANADKDKLNGPPFSLETSFSHDHEGFLEFLEFQHFGGVYPARRRERDGKIEIEWRTYSPFESTTPIVTWRSLPDGSDASLTFQFQESGVTVGMCLSWGDAQSGVFSGASFPEVPQHEVVPATMIPAYLEFALRSAKQFDFSSKLSEEEIENAVKKTKAMLEYLKIQMEKKKGFKEASLSQPLRALSLD